MNRQLFLVTVVLGVGCGRPTVEPTKASESARAVGVGPAAAFFGTFHLLNAVDAHNIVIHSDGTYDRSVVGCDFVSKSPRGLPWTFDGQVLWFEGGSWGVQAAANGGLESVNGSGGSAVPQQWARGAVCVGAVGADCGLVPCAVPGGL